MPRGKRGKQGANNGTKVTQRPAQRTAMPMTCIEPYVPPRPTISELMGGRPAGADDGGIPPKGCLGRQSKSAYRTEDR